MKRIVLKEIDHRGEMCVAFYFEKDSDLMEQIKKLKNIRWSSSKGLWYQKAADFKKSDVFALFKGKAYVDITEPTRIQGFLASAAPNKIRGQAGKVYSR